MRASRTRKTTLGAADDEKRSRMRRSPFAGFVLALLTLAAACVAPAVRPTPATPALPSVPPRTFDVLVRGGDVYDGNGAAALRADLGIDGDRIAAIGDLSAARGRSEIDARGLAVAPGFINMLSWADESLLVDGRSLSDILQGVTLEVFGEGTSMGPLNEAMRRELLEEQSELRYEVPWTTLGEYLAHLEAKGVSTNVASFIGAATVRVHELGYENRAPTPEQLERMKQLVRQAMAEGALGVGSSLPYIPATFSSTDELVALAGVAAESGGMYISHIRDEGSKLLESIDEFLDIVRRAGVRGEIYHLKASGKANWPKLPEALGKIEAVRAQGLAVTADMYPYHASSTGLTYALPAWVQEGGHEELMKRLRDPAVRARLPQEMDLIPPEDLLLSSFRNPALRHLTGKTLADVARARGVAPEVAIMDLILEDDSRIGTVRFTMSEDGVRQAMARPWVAFCSDAGSIAPVPPFTNSQPHPRAYGSFARVLGKYVRDDKVLSLAEAIRRLSGFPATNLRLEARGFLRPGFFADVVLFDPATIRDHATFEAPHRLATGIRHVLVNGVPVVRDGQHTGAKPGRFVHGPGWRGNQAPISGSAPGPAADPIRVSHTGPKIGDALKLLDLWIAEQVDYGEIPGLAIAVLQGSDVVWSATYGLADLATRAPVTARTRFRLGSVSKLFTATAILQLRDSGKLSLDDPVRKHLPWFNVQSTFSEPITVRHLLTHTAGLPREGAFPYWTTHVFPSREQLRSALASQSTVYPPGERYKYSNLGVALLGEIVVAASGETFTDYLRRHVFEPLGMSSSTAAPTAPEIASLARAYERKRSDAPRKLMTYYDTGALAPAAAVVSTLEDLSRFAAFHLTGRVLGAQPGGQPGGQPPLATATRKEMQRPHFIYPSWTGGRGLGFGISRRNDTTFVTHGGWIGGHRSDLLLSPADNLAIVALTNADDASPGLFTRKAFDVLAPAFAAATTESPRPRRADPAWQRLLGTYTDPWGWEHEVLLLDDELVFYEHGYPPEDDPDAAITRLTPVDGKPLVFKLGDGEFVTFETDASGGVTRIQRRYEYLTPVRR
jgi:N-acyl-D-amino-acid deacylase